MTADMKSILFAFIIITTFPEGKSQSWQDMSLPQNDFLNFFFPKDPGLVRVRRMNRPERMNSKVLDFVSIVFNEFCMHFISSLIYLEQHYMMKL